MNKYNFKVGKVYRFIYNNKPRLGRLIMINKGQNYNLLFNTGNGYKTFNARMMIDLKPAGFWTSLLFYLFKEIYD